MAGGYPHVWRPRPTWQPAYTYNATNNPCSGGAQQCRSVPDISASANPSHGVVAYFGGDGGWTIFGGTSAVAPSIAGLVADTNQGLQCHARAWWARRSTRRITAPTTPT